MIKNQMLFPLAVDTATVKATTDVGYTATDEELQAYTIGFIPYEMIEKSLLYRSAQIGTLKGKNNLNQNNYFGYTVDRDFRSTKGVPFCYSYAVNPYTTSLNAYLDSNDDYITAPWGAASTAGLLHSYDVDTIINNTPNLIPETTGIYASFSMFALYVPDGVDTSAGVWSTTNGENGWVTKLQNKTATIDTLNLTFSVTSSTDGSYMPTPVTFTEADLENSVNGIMVKPNGTTSYAGVTYNIYVHCIIHSAFLYDNSSVTLKDGITQLNGIRFSNLGYGSTPYYASVASGYVVQNSFTCGVIDGIDLALPGSNGYYLLTSTTGYEYFRSGSDLNNLLSGGITETDLKIIRSVARPVYKISGAFYVAEFDDDYTITGDLIPYAQARAWQKFINPDNNTFDYNDIPEPSPGDEGPDSGGDNIAPYDFTNTPLSAANNFTTLYALTTDQVAQFGAIMWASLSDPNFWHAVGVEFSNDFSINPADMMRYFNFLRYYPFDLTPYSSQYISGIYIGRSTIPIEFPAGVEYPRRATRNLIQIDGGDVTVLLPDPYNTDDFFVSDPATQIQAHIPFCGSVQLSAAECYGRKLYLKYVVDLQSGAIQATIAVQSDAYYIVATLAGTCGAGVQITANNNIEYLTRIATIATGGLSSAATMATQGAKIAGAEGAAVGAVAGALTGTVSALAGLPHVTVHKQGNTTGFANYGGDPQAYITIQTPKRSNPPSYSKTVGYISNKQAKIADLSGYTEMINPDLSGIEAHQDELEEIRRLLETGFYA